MKLRTTEIQRFSTTVTCRVEFSIDGRWENCGLAMCEIDAWKIMCLLLEVGCRAASVQHEHINMVTNEVGIL